MCSLRRWPNTRPTSHAINNSAFLAGALAAFLLAGCAGAGDAAPVVKIGVIAPFEGLGRPLGYALLPEVQDLVAQANAAGSLGRYRVAVVAFNDDQHAPFAEAQAQALALDPDVMAVIGPWTSVTTQEAAPVLDAARAPSVSGAMTDPAPATLAHTSCPPPEAVAQTLLARADGLRLPVLAAGPDNSLMRALLAERPSLVALEGQAALPNTATVIHTGDAEGAADDVRRWRDGGWEGMLLGGPDVAQPWFTQRAGARALGARALACGGTPTGAVNGDAATAAVAASARAATGAVLEALAEDIESTGSPSRAGVAARLGAAAWPHQSHWLEAVGGRWQVETRAVQD